MVATERHVRVCIPHHFREDIDDPRYGSRRPGSRLARGLALGRCLAALLDLQRRREQAQLGIGQSSIDQFPCRPEADMVGNVRLEIHVCSDGRHQLDEVLQHFNGQIHRHRIDLADPRVTRARVRVEKPMALAPRAEAAGVEITAVRV